MYSILTLIGALWVSVMAYKFVSFLHLHLRSSSLHRYAHKRGDDQPWALVTGSSDGIGLGFAHELARAGFNIILHGRNRAKLEDRKKALAQEFPKTDIRFIVADVCDDAPMEKKVDLVVDQLKGLHLTVLVNNVGGPPPRMEPLYKSMDAYTPNEIEGMLDMNIRFTAHLTRCVVPILNRDKKPGLIINTGSAADMGLPWLSMYAGAKGF